MTSGYTVIQMKVVELRIKIAIFMIYKTTLVVGRHASYVSAGRLTIVTSRDINSARAVLYFLAGKYTTIKQEYLHKYEL